MVTLPPQDQTNFSSEGLTNLHLFAVMRKYNVVLGFFLVSSIFLKVVISLISMGTAQNVHEYIESFISTTRKEVPSEFG